MIFDELGKMILKRTDISTMGGPQKGPRAQKKKKKLRNLVPTRQSSLVNYNFENSLYLKVNFIHHRK